MAITSISQVGGDINKLKDLVSNRYGSSLSGLTVSGNSLTGVLDGKPVKWSFDKYGNPIKTELSTPTVNKPITPTVSTTPTVNKPITPTVSTTPTVNKPITPTVSTTPTVNKPITPTVSTTPTVNKPITPTVSTTPQTTSITSISQVGGDINKLKDLVSNRYGSSLSGLTVSGNSLTGVLDGKPVKWSFDSAGNPIKTELSTPTVNKPITPTVSTTPQTTSITSISQVGGDINKLKDLVSNRYGSSLSGLTVSGNSLTGVLDGKPVKWSFDKYGNPIKTELPITKNQTSDVNKINQTLNMNKTNQTSDVNKINQISDGDITNYLNDSSIEIDKQQEATDKIKSLTDIKEEGLKNTNSAFKNAFEILQTGNKKLLNLYGIDEEGNIDINNKNSIISNLEQMRAQYEQSKKELFNNFKSTRYQQASGMIRQRLASRGIDASKIPQEQLIALSDKVGREVFSDIYEAKQKLFNEIDNNNKQIIAQINTLREKGLLSNNDMKRAVEALRQEANDKKLSINKEFVNAIFGVKDAYIQEKENRALNTANIVLTLGRNLGLSGTRMGALSKYMNYPNAASALKAMAQDLNNKNSDLYKNTNEAEKAAIEKAQTELNLKLLQIQNKGTSTSSKFSAKDQTFLSLITGTNIQTVDDLNKIIPSLTDKQKAEITNYLDRKVFIGDIISNNSSEDLKKK